MSQLLTSSVVLAAFFGGVVALLAPCCISVMLSAYFASGFKRRSRILGMTFVFAAGVATVILPIALGASALSTAPSLSETRRSTALWASVHGLPTGEPPRSAQKKGLPRPQQY